MPQSSSLFANSVVPSSANTLIRVSKLVPVQVSILNDSAQESKLTLYHTSGLNSPIVFE